MNFNQIKRSVKEEVEKRKKEYPLEWLGRSLAYNNYPPRDILPYLSASEDKSYGFIYTIDIHQDSINILKIAQDYGSAGVDVISVEVLLPPLDLELITSIRRYVATPIIQRGYMVDMYQLVESVVYGADCVELIPKILSAKELKNMLEYARHLGLEALVKIEDKEDLTKAIFAGATALLVSSDNYKELVPLIPNKKVIVCEGRFESKEVMQSIALEGVDAFMVQNYSQDLLQKV